MCRDPENLHGPLCSPRKNLQGAPLLFITNLNNKTTLALPGYPSLWDSAALPAQESSLRLTYRCEVIIDHSKHQLFPPVVLPKSLSRRPLGSVWSGDADTRLKGYCVYVKAINKFSWEGWSYVFLSLCVRAVNVCVRWTAGNGVRPLKQARVLAVERLSTVVLSWLLSRFMYS